MVVTYDESDYEVRGTLAMVMRFSRIFGVAPLHLIPHGDCYIARVSKMCTVYGWVLFAFLNGVMLTALYLDVNFLEGERTYRVETWSALIVWLIDIAMLSTILGIGMWQGAARMQRTLTLLKRIQKVSNGVKGYTEEGSNEKSTSIIVIAVFIATNGFMIFEFAFRYLIGSRQNKKMIVLKMYNVHYFKHNMVLLLVMQITFVVLTIRSSFRTINKALDELRDLSKFQTVLIPTHPHSISTIKIDQVRNEDVFKTVDFLTVKKYIHELANSYNSLCNEVEIFNNDNGLMMFIVLGVFTGYLMIASYYMIKAFCKSGPDDDAVITVILEIFFCSYHYLHLFLLIEPCHLTHNEMSKTQIVLNKVMYHVTPVGHQILTEIDVFFKQLLLYKPTFSPLNVSTLHISQIATIFAAVTTYLTIIIQYRVIEECQ